MSQPTIDQSEDRLRRALAIETVGVLFFTATGEITDANQAFLRMSGYTREDLRSGLARWDTMTPPEWMPRSLEAVEEFITTGRVSPYEKQYIRKDGSRFWGLFAGTRVSEDEGMEYVIDVTERREAEESVLEHQAELVELRDSLSADLAATTRLHELSTRLVDASGEDQLLLEILQAIMELQSADFGTIQQFDPAAGSLEIVAQQGFDNAFLDHFETVDAEDDSAGGRALRSGARIVIEDVDADPRYAPHRTAAAAAGYRAVQSTPILTPEGEQVGIVSTHFTRPHRPSERDLRLTDLYVHTAGTLLGRVRTARKLAAAKEATDRANAAQLRFLTTMSHELRTPLAAVVGFADLLATEVVGSLNEQQKKHLGTIKSSAWHVVTVLDEIMTFARADSGAEEARIGAADLAGIAREVVDMLMPEALSKGLELRVRGADRPVTGETDGGKVRQILTNLVGNAIKYTAAGSIELEVTEHEDRVSFSIHDSGSGIAPDRIDEIFEPFTQVHDPAEDTRSGAGLGLAVSRRLAHLLDGAVTVESAVGEGSIFTLQLPRHLE